MPECESLQFLPKPFSLKELATTVKMTLEASPHAFCWLTITSCIADSLGVIPFLAGV